MTVIRKQIDTATEALEITVGRQEYMPKWEASLKEARKKARIKGFRNGKTPMGLIKRMYGQKLLTEAVSEVLQESIDRFVKDNELQILGQAIPDEAGEMPELNPNELSDYTFRYIIGLAPKFELVDFSTLTMERHQVEITEDMVDEEFESARKRFGKMEAAEEVGATSQIELSIIELDEEGAIKEDAISNSFRSLVSDLSDEVKEGIMGQAVGYRFEVDILNFEKDRSKEYVWKYFLGLEGEVPEDVPSRFEAELMSISDLKPAALGAEFYKSWFGKDIEGEEEAREEIKKGMRAFFEKQANNLLDHEIKKKLLDLHEADFPEAYIKRLIRLNKPDLSDEAVEHELKHTIEDLHWGLLFNRCVEQEGVEVSQEELQAGFVEQINRYFGGQLSAEYMPEMLKHMMKDQKQVEQMYMGIQSDKVFEAIRSKITIVEKSISAEAFNDLVKEFNESGRAQRH